MVPGRVEAREFEYERHGTLTLIGNFHVVTGEWVAPTLGPTRTEQDLWRMWPRRWRRIPRRRGCSWWTT